MKKHTAPAILAALGLALTMGTALASTGYATRDTNVRAGAGTGYDIVGSLEKGEEVEIIECDDGWCEVEDGYVSARHLKLGGSADDEDEDEDEEVSVFDHEEGTFDFDPYDIEDSIPESIHDGFDD
jgi:hypothetical protein